MKEKAMKDMPMQDIGGPSLGSYFRPSLSSLLEQIRKGWCLACYLIINWRIDELVKLGQVTIPMDVFEEVGRHLHAYVYENKMPPAAIQQTVLNLAEDYVSGKPVAFKAGDYIAMQNFMRSRNKPG